MGQNFLPDTVNQTHLFPPSLHDWLPEDHLARFAVWAKRMKDAGAKAAKTRRDRLKWKKAGLKAAQTRKRNAEKNQGAASLSN
jgi:hypothetical protein